MPVLDAHMIAAVLGISAVGGILGLDRTAAGQFMISQPIVAGPLTGWLLGDPTAGFVIGTVLELIWLLDMPVGTFVPADATIGTVVATGAAALGSPGGATLPVLGFCLLFTTAIVPLTMLSDEFVRKRNAKFAEAVLATEAGGLERAIARAQAVGLAVFFLKSFMLCLILIPAGIGALMLFGRAPAEFHRAMTVFVKLLPLLGAALIVRKMSVKSFDGFLLTGFAAAAVVGQLFHAPAVVVVLLTMMSGWLGARYSAQRR